jgi:hypothetical protein
MGHKATIGNRMTSAPRVAVTARESASQTARRGAEMSFPVTVTRINAGLPGSTVAERRDGHMRQGPTTSGTRNQVRAWRVVKAAGSGTFIRAEYRVKGGLITVRKINSDQFKGWMGFLTTGGMTVPVAAVTRDQCIEPHRIQDETRRIALRNAAQIGHGEL